MTSMLKRILRTVLFVASFTFPALSSDGEFSHSQNDLLNTAGRQRMLSQQAAVLALRQDLNSEQKQAQLAATIKTFSQAHAWLSARANTNATREAMQEVNALFSAYQQQLQNEKRDLKEVVLLSERLLDSCEKVVKRFESDYGLKDPSAVNLIGRMRMLSQRQAKWYLVWNHHIAINHLGDSLNQSVQQSDIIVSILGNHIPSNDMKPKWSEMEKLLREQKHAIRSAYQSQFDTTAFVERANRLLQIAHELTNQWAKS